MSDVHVQNVYAYFTAVVANGLMGNIDTIQTHSDTLNILTRCTEGLTNDWTTDDKKDAPATLPDPGNPNKKVNLYQALQWFIKNGEKGHKFWADLFDQWCQNNLGTGANLNLWSSALGIMAMRALSANNWGGSGSPSPGDMNMINQFNSLISSQGQNEEGTGQNETKTETSVTQQDSSAQQPWADAGNSFNGIASNLANLLQQSY